MTRSAALPALFYVSCSLVWGSSAAQTADPAPIERCAKVQLPEDFDPTSVASIEKAVKGGPRILYALGKERHQLLRRLLSEGENPNVCVLGSSVLSLSAFRGDVEEIRILLDGGAHPDKPLDENGGTPLTAALGMARFEAGQLLLARGANPLHRTDGELTTLHELASAVVAPGSEAESQQLKLADQLIRHGVSVNSPATANRTTPLMLAALRDSRSLVYLLVENGADVNVHNVRGLTAEDFARKKGFTEIAEFLNRAPVKRDTGQ
jgi:uncharacterized protein